MPVTVASIRRSAKAFASTESFLLQARAALRKQPTPVEAPINPINAPALPKSTVKARRAGRPSINLPSEKMDAFLTEVKSVKLKKVSGTMAPPLVPESAANSTALALARELGASGKGKQILKAMERRKSLSELVERRGEKRKRDAADAEGQSQPGK